VHGPERRRTGRRQAVWPGRRRTGRWRARDSRRRRRRVEKGRWQASCPGAGGLGSQVTDWGAEEEAELGV
jgi:hypothetical protein